MTTQYYVFCRRLYAKYTLLWSGTSWIYQIVLLLLFTLISSLLSSSYICFIIVLKQVNLYVCLSWSIGELEKRTRAEQQCVAEIVSVFWVSLMMPVWQKLANRVPKASILQLEILQRHKFCYGVIRNFSDKDLGHPKLYWVPKLHKTPYKQPALHCGLS